MSNISILNSVRNYMTSNYMNVDEDWLSECVNHLIENNFNENEIKLQTKEQWLLNNLTDVCQGCLPLNLKSFHKTELKGPYVLQINAVEDVGSSAYQQHLKLQKVNTENIEATSKFDEKIPSHRMLKLYMTDGVQEVIGVEYTPMRNVGLDVVPGSKVLVKGPVQCRRGVILLTESCIELLGGEVAELILANSQAAILSSKLNIQISQSSMSNQHNGNVPPPNIQINHSAISHEQNQPMTNFIEDEIDLDHLDAIEAQYSNAQTKRRSEDDISNIDKKIKRNYVTSTDDVGDYPDEEDMFLEDEEYLRELEAKFDERENEINANPSGSNCGLSRSKSNDLATLPKSPTISPSTSTDDRPQLDSRSIRPSPEPFVYIKQINEMDDTEKIGKVFKVKAQILKTTSKLTVGKEGWSLSCTIVDGTGTIDVDFSNDVLSKLVGITHQDMIKMKKQMATNADVKNAAVLAVQKAKDNLQILYCIIELIIIERPLITQLIPFESCHATAVARRLQQAEL